MVPALLSYDLGRQLSADNSLLLCLFSMLTCLHPFVILPSRILETWSINCEIFGALFYMLIDVSDPQSVNQIT